MRRRHEHIVKNDDLCPLAVMCLRISRQLRRGDRRAATATMVTPPYRLACATHCKCSVLFGMGPARHDQKLVHVGDACHDRLGATNDDSVLHIDVRIDLPERFSHSIRLSRFYFQRFAARRSPPPVGEINLECRPPSRDQGDFILDNQNGAILLWSRTGYRFVKRQSQGDPNIWVALGHARSAPATAAAAR